MVEGLTHGVDELLNMDVHVMSDVELHSVVVSLEAQMSRLRAAEALLVGEWDKRRVWASDDSRSAAARLGRETGMAPSSARAIIKRARRLLSMPKSLEALVDGSLSTDRVDLLVSANDPSVSDRFSVDEEMLVSQLVNLRFSDCVRVTTYWSQLADDARCEDKGSRLRDSRHLHAARTIDGAVDVSGLLDPVGGEIFVSEIERIEQELFENDWAEIRSRYGDEANPSHLSRSHSQRRVDALVEMARRSRSTPAGSIRPRPLITVLVDYNTFTGRISELASGTVIAPGQVIPLLAEADIERIVFDGGSRVIDVGRKRLFSGALRRAIEVRDRICSHESCDQSVSRCQVDHIQPYAHGGLTEQTNGRLVCGPHNRAKGAQPP